MPDLIWFEWERPVDGYSLETLAPGKISFLHDPREDYYFVWKVADDAPAWFCSLVDHYKGNDDLLYLYLNGRGYPGDEFWEREAPEEYAGGEFFVPIGNKIELYRPLDENPGLFMEFAETALTRKGVCGFVSKYGPIVSYGAPTHTPSDINYIITLIGEMKAVVDEWRSGGLPDDWPSKAFVARIPTLGVTLKRQPGSSRHSLHLTPSSLIEAMQIQFMQSVSNDTQLRRCAVCPTWFSFGTGTGRRKSAHYCSDKCRKAAHRKQKAEKHNG